MMDAPQDDPGPDVPSGLRSQNGPNWSDLTSRFLSGAVLIILGALLLISSGIWLRVGVSVICGGMMWELAQLTGWRHQELHSPRHPVLIGILSALTLLAMLTMPGDWPLILILVPIVLGFAGTHSHQRTAYALATVAILLAGYSLVVLIEVMGLGTTLWVIAVVILSDVLGYFAGRKFGGPKLWPAISPKKTWSGTVAGWIGATALGIVLVLSDQVGWSAVFIGPVLAIFGQAGDIAESWLKRRVGVKDSSNLIPGHGGLLDRFDAMSGALLAALLFMFAGILPVVGG